MDEKAAKNLHLYKYNAVDEGICYKYLWNPLATKLVSHLPDWVAPNTLTLLSFLHVLVGTLLFFYFSGLSL